MHDQLSVDELALQVFVGYLLVVLGRGIVVAKEKGRLEGA
jgi:hypothetical protein